MKETRMPPASAANLVANSGNTIYGVSVIDNKSVLVQVIVRHQTGDKANTRINGDPIRSGDYA